MTPPSTTPSHPCTGFRLPSVADAPSLSACWLSPVPAAGMMSPSPEPGELGLRAELEALGNDVQLRFAHSDRQQAQLEARLDAAQQQNLHLATELQQAQDALESTQAELAELRASGTEIDNALRRELLLAGEQAQGQRRELTALQGGLQRTQGELVALQNATLVGRRELQLVRQSHQQDVAGMRQTQIVLNGQVDALQGATTSLTAGLLVLVLLLIALAAATLVLWFRKGRHLLRSLREQQTALPQQLAALLGAAPAPAEDREPDHAPMLKFANEVSRMEMNLARMDSAAKGHKQLARGLERIRNNLAAAGYEMVPMLGQPWQEGLRADADFVEERTLPEGERRITAISRPQVNYKGILIQKACVTVSQNI